MYKANNSLRLIPPPPPPPPAPRGELPPPPPPPSPEEHLLKMHKLGSLFIYDGKEVTYEEAVRLAKGGVTEIKTPYPYSNPPKTFIGSKDNNVPQKPAIKKGDTLTITVTETGQKALAVMNNNKNGTIIDKLPENAGVDGRQLEIYNRLTSKYKNKTVEQIPAADLKTIQIIYDNMNDEQKDKNQPHPINQKSNHFEVKASYDEDGSLSKNVEEHALNGGTFEFEGKEISKEEAILKSKEPNITTETSTLHNKMIIHKDLLQQKALYYYNDKLLSDDEVIELFENPLYTMQLISRGSNKEKQSFKFVKIKE